MLVVELPSILQNARWFWGKQYLQGVSTHTDVVAHVPYFVELHLRVGGLLEERLVVVQVLEGGRRVVRASIDGPVSREVPRARLPRRRDVLPQPRVVLGLDRVVLDVEAPLPVRVVADRGGSGGAGAMSHMCKDRAWLG